MQCVMVATDGSPSSTRAVRLAAELARQAHGRLIIAHVLPPLDLAADACVLPGYVDSVGDERQRKAEQLLNSQRALCGEDLPVRMLLLEGGVAQALTSAADREKADLLVVGTGGGGAFRRAMLGSVSSKLVHTCERPVTVVP